MFKRRRAYRDKAAEATRAIFTRMDALEVYDWDWLQDDEKAGKDAAARHRVLPGVPDQIGELLAMVNGSRDGLMEILHFWHETRSAEFDEAGDKDRSDHVTAIYLTFGVNGIGNLFGYIPETAPAFNEKLAAAGRERGWRT